MQDIFKTNGSVSVVSGMSPSLVSWSAAHAKALCRFANSMLFVNYVQLSGPMTEEKWDLLLYRGMLKVDEITILKRIGGSQSTILFSWAVAIVRAATRDGIFTQEDATYVINHLGTIRGLSAKQIGYSLHQVPRTYFHLMWLCVQTLIIVSMVLTGRRGTSIPSLPPLPRQE